METNRLAVGYCHVIVLGTVMLYFEGCLNEFK
jgi:hypothetical protein